MTDRENCRACGAPRPTDAPSGLCPVCLLKAGLASDPGEVTVLFGPASSSVLAAIGEEFGKIPPVLLRDADSASDPGPVIRPSSEEIPDPAERSARLQLFGEIARGGMGVVLKGRDADLGRDLAVKILLDTHRDKPDMVRRFIEEAQIAGQLQHPGIVPVYELGAFGDRRPYFAMKLVKGHTLAEILANRKSPGEGLPRLLSIFESICQTMAYAHARGVIHRDLKPSNVMVGSFGEVQVMDWGLAKVLPRGGTVDDASAGQTKNPATVISTARSQSDSDQSQAGSVLGTPAYMAPEQARGELDQMDERVDVFALGSIFCELLTGQPAFTGRNSGEILRKAARGELADAVTRLDQDNLGHDPELIALAKSCLAPEREDRPRHAGEIAAQMSQYHSRVQERLRQSEIERAAETARAEEATKRVAVERQRLRLTVALAASILGLIVLGGGGWAHVTQQRIARQAATERIVTEAIDRATILRGEAKAATIEDLSKWTQALAAANEARSSMEAGEPTVALRGRVVELLAALENERGDSIRRADELEKDKKLFERLDAIRVNSVDHGKLVEELENMNQEYAQAFRDFGIDVDQLEPDAAAPLFRRRERPEEFASRLDDWALLRKENEAVGDKHSESWKHLISIAKAVDEDPWRNSLRSLIGQADHEAVRRLAVNEEELEKQPARSLYLLAQVLEITDDVHYRDQYLSESIDVLKLAWRLSPNDYQICRALGSNSRTELDRVRFSTAAVTVRHGNPYARRGLAEAFLPPRMADVQWHEMIDKRGRFFKTLQWTGDSLSYRAPRFQFKTKSGIAISIGPMWTFDPKTISTEALDEALGEFRVASSLAPKDLSIQMGLAKVLILQGRYDEALKGTQIFAGSDPKLSGITYELVLAFYLKGELDYVIDLIRRENEAAPDEERDLMLLGMSYHELGKKQLAFAAYRDVFVKPKGGMNTGVGIELLKDTGTPEQVIAVLSESIKAQPENIELHEGLASFLREQGKTDEANAEINQAIDLVRKQLRSNPNNIHLHQRLAKLLKLQGKPDEVIAAYRDAIKAHPENVEFHESLAELFEQQGKIAEVNAEFDEVIRLLRDQLRSREECWPLQRLGTVYLRRGQRQDAVAQFRRMLEVDPKGSEACNDIAWQLATDPNPKLRDGEIAVEFATKACEITEWKNAANIDTLAAAYAESGDFDTAVKWQTEAIELLTAEGEKGDYGARLTLYQQKMPYRSSSPAN